MSETRETPAVRVDLSGVRRRLDGAQGRTYWKSLEELAQTPEFLDFLHREFPSQASELTDPKGRREFLTLMGASLALAGLTGCTKQPEEKIVPYVPWPHSELPWRTSAPNFGLLRLTPYAVFDGSRNGSGNI